MSRVVVLVPLKPFERAKSRLGSHYDPATRTRIAEALATNVLSTLALAFPDAARIVVGEASLEAFTNAHGALLLLEEERASLGEKLDAALDTLEWERAFVVMGDLPDIAIEDLHALRDADTDAQLVLVESADGTGTNAMRLLAPRAIALGFADPSSCEVHASRALEAGVRYLRLRLPSLARDLDSPSDLAPRERSRFG